MLVLFAGHFTLLQGTHGEIEWASMRYVRSPDESYCVDQISKIIKFVERDNMMEVLL
jgi:hypothetical protein